MHINQIVFDGTNNTEPSSEQVIKVLKLLHPIAYPKYSIPKPIIRGQKLKRNDPCFCGSGKKFKKCCNNKEVE